MKSVCGDIKFFEANITHQRNGKKNHSFKNQTNATLIDLKNNTQKKNNKISYIIFSKKFQSFNLECLKTWKPM